MSLYFNNWAYLGCINVGDYEYEDSLLILNLNEETEVDDLLI